MVSMRHAGYLLEPMDLSITQTAIHTMANYNKLRLFRTFCFYDLGLWKCYKVGTMNKLPAAYIKCILIFLATLNLAV